MRDITHDNFATFPRLLCTHQKYDCSFRLTQGTDNALSDLGFDDIEGLSAKAALALKINGLLYQRSLTQIVAAAITGGITQPKVSQI